MGGSLRLGRVAGIGIYIHWTFLILIGLILFSGFLQGELRTAPARALFVLAIFGCVLLHELGHALTAKRFGVRTRDITLLPIGGVARLERIPENPAQELLITINGPLVNLAIAIVLMGVLFVTGGWRRLPTSADEAQALLSGAGFVYNLMAANVFLAIFNFLPAFPMDGGRILRALLAFFLPYADATRVAARVGQAMAVVLAIAGLLWNPLLLLIAVFIFIGAESESQATALRSAFAGLRVGDGMMTAFRTLSEGDTLGDAAAALLAGAQQDFPVLSPGQSHNGAVAGMLTRSDLVRALAQSGPSAPVEQAMQRDGPVLSPGSSLQEALERMREAGVTAVPVVDGGRLVGLLTLENLTELAALREALGRGRAA
jgi:Zn-dependent protease/predicted transcriptional regulator